MFDVTNSLEDSDAFTVLSFISYAVFSPTDLLVVPEVHLQNR